jgi:hypothetical protein
MKDLYPENYMKEPEENTNGRKDILNSWIRISENNLLCYYK